MYSHALHLNMAKEGTGRERLPVRQRGRFDLDSESAIKHHRTNPTKAIKSDLARSPLPTIMCCNSVQNSDRGRVDVIVAFMSEY